MRCIICRSSKRLNGDSLCRSCQRCIDGRRSALKTDRFWLVTVAVPMLLMAALGTVLVVAAMAR